MRATLWYTMILVIAVLAVAVALVFATCLSITITTPSAAGKSTFSSSPKNISCQCDTTGTCTVTWSSEDIAGVSESWPSGSTGTSVTLRLTTLPSDNDQFGDTWVKAAYGTVSDTNHFDLFFSEEETNHPGGGTPNWYYYWSQTSADYGTQSYSGQAGTGQCVFTGGTWVAYLYSGANETTAAGTWNNAEGIDLFANLCRHEERHRLDMIALWGVNSDRVAADDLDEDWLPDDDEAALVPGHAYDNEDRCTYTDTFNYGEDPIPDVEDYCLRRQAAWSNGDADDEDWANPGHQY